MRLTAFEEPTMTSAKKAKVNQPIFVMTGDFKERHIKRARLHFDAADWLGKRR